MAKEKNGKNLIIIALFVIVICMSVGFAFLSTTLNINGNATVKANSWDIHFENLEVTDGSVTGESVVEAATIDTASTTMINYSIVLNEPGEFYEFTVDVVNDGSLDAKVSVAPTISGVSSDQDVYVNYTVTYEDGTEIAANDVLNAGDTATYKVRVEYDKNISSDQLPSEDQTLTLVFASTYVQA